MYFKYRSDSSAGEHYLDRVGVGGSNPSQIIKRALTNIP